MVHSVSVRATGAKDKDTAEIVQADSVNQMLATPATTCFQWMPHKTLSLGFARCLCIACEGMSECSGSGKKGHGHYLALAAPLRPHVIFTH